MQKMFRRFSGSKMKPVIPEVMEIERKKEESEINQKIQALLDSPEIIDYDQPFVFKGNLILCPTPIGNLKDISFRAFEALMSADLIACEDTRTTGKLLTLLKEKKFGERLDEILGKKDKFATQTPTLDEEVEADENVFRDFAEKRASEVIDHPNEQTVRRLKKKMRDFHQQLEVEETKNKAKNILLSNDNLGFLAKYEMGDDVNENSKKNKKSKLSNLPGGLSLIDQKQLVPSPKENQKNDDEDFYDTHSETRKKNKEKNEKDLLEDEFIAYIKKKIYESKLKKGRGLLLSCHRFNEEERIESLLKCMKSGLKVVLVPDAGSPCLSDPGQILINEAIKNKISIESLPGPNSVVLALTSSGFPASNFSFLSFWPKNEGDEKIFVERMKRERCTTVFFENKNRIMTTLLTLEKEFGKRQMVFVGVELTKLHERLLRGTIRDVYDTLNKNPDYTMPSLKGELTVVMAPYRREFNIDLVNLDEILNGPKIGKSTIFPDIDKSAEITIDLNKLIRVLNQNVQISTKDMAALLNKAVSVSKNKLYDRIVAVKKTSGEEDDEEGVKQSDKN